MTLRFVIVNETDKPCARHVAQVMPCGKVCRYIHQDLRHWNEMAMDEAVDIQKFGFQVLLPTQKNKRGQRVEFINIGKPSAKYKNGANRFWQDNDNTYEFSLYLWEFQRKESV